MKRSPLLRAALLCLLLATTAGAQGLLPISGGPPVSDVKLRELIDTYIPEYHSTILIFTQCYGGNFIAPFTGRERTVAMSASAPGSLSYYGGFHDDAARAVSPAEGKTSHDIFNAATAGKSVWESPLIMGDAQPYTPVSADGEIRSRHVLVYAGQPERLDVSDAETIRAQLEGQPGTTVTIVAGALPKGTPGADSWKPDYPATAEGLATALAEIGATMSEHEQFVLFVTDHGSRQPISETFNLGPAGTAGSSHNAALALTASEVEFLNTGASELGKAGFLLFLPDAPEPPETGELEITLDFVSDIPINMVYEYQLPEMHGFGSVHLGYGVYFEVEPEVVAEQVQEDGTLDVWFFNRGLQTYLEMTSGLVMPPSPKAGISDLLGTVEPGADSPTTLPADEAGPHAIWQFSISNASLTDPLVLETFDFRIQPDGSPEFIKKIVSLDLYHDVDADGRVSEADYLIDSLPPAESGNYRFQAEPLEVVVPADGGELFVVAAETQ